MEQSDNTCIFMHHRQPIESSYLRDQISKKIKKKRGENIKKNWQRNRFGFGKAKKHQRDSH
uniref:Uncharacterized protein n=1 Tax=Setaria italica TaxID=4555 RepID=K4A4D4_SETIT